MTAVALPGAARLRVDRIKVGVEAVWHLIAESYQARDWEALGYTSWDDMCTREFGTSRLRLPREERQEVVASLREQGLSIRAIAAVTGDHYSTVSRELSAVADATPERVLVAIAESEEAYAAEIAEEATQTVDAPVHIAPEPAKVIGIDGKTYTPSPKPARTAPYRKPLPDVAKTAGFEFRQSMDRVLRVFEDNRYRQNEEQVANALRGHLLYVAETVAAVIDQLPN